MNQVSPIKATQEGFIVQTQKITFPVLIPNHISSQHREILRNSKKFKDFIRGIIAAPEDIKVKKMEVLSVQIFRGNRMGYATMKVFGEQMTSKGIVSFEDYAFIQGGSVGILVFVNDKLAVVNQYRVAKQKMCVEPPAGMLDQSGDLKSKVLDQLQQQTNIVIQKSDLVHMGSMHPNVAISDEQFHLYYCKISLTQQKMKEIEDKIHGEAGSLQKIKVRFIQYDPQQILAEGNSSFITMAAFYQFLIKGKDQRKREQEAGV